MHGNSQISHGMFQKERALILGAKSVHKSHFKKNIIKKEKSVE